MKYYVVSGPIESSNINENSLYKSLLDSQQIFGFQNHEDAKRYAADPTPAANQLRAIYEIEIEDKIEKKTDALCKLQSGEILSGAVIIQRTILENSFPLIGYCNGKRCELTDECEITDSLEEEADLQQAEAKRQKEEWLAQEAQRLKEALAASLAQEANRRQKANEIKFKQSLKHCIDDAKKGVDTATVEAKRIKDKAQAIKFYLKFAIILSCHLSIFFIISSPTVFPIIVEFLAQMGIVYPLTQMTVIGVSVATSFIFSLSLLALYYTGVGLKKLLVNDKCTEEEKHKQDCNDLIDKLDAMSRVHFSNPKDRLFINELTEMGNRMEDTQFKKNGCLARSEKQPHMNRYQFLLFEYKSLQEVVSLKGKVRFDKEEEILSEATTKFHF